MQTFWGFNCLLLLLTVLKYSSVVGCTYGKISFWSFQYFRISNVGEESIEAKWYIGLVLKPLCFCNLRQLRVFLLHVGWILVHRRVTLWAQHCVGPQNSGLPKNTTATAQSPNPDRKLIRCYLLKKPGLSRVWQLFLCSAFSIKLCYF